MFSDGILLNKNINYRSFQLFPKSSYLWSAEDGLFKQNLLINPISFFGFSAYLNNSQSSGFLCYLIDSKVRLKAFEDFNIQLSPLSIKEVKNIESQLPDSYIKILENKNKNIFKPNYSSEFNSYELFSELLFGGKKFDDIYGNPNYLNR